MNLFINVLKKSNDGVSPLMVRTASRRRVWRRRYRRRHMLTNQAMYVLAVVLPPWPVQFVWKNSPRGLSTRSYVWAPK